MIEFTCEAIGSWAFVCCKFLIQMLYLVCPRGLLNCHFFSFFFHYSLPWQFFPPFFQLTYLFCLIYSAIISSSIFFISVIILFICLFFISSNSLLNIACIFSVMPPFFFWDLESSLRTLLWILFQVDCLASFHLAVLLGLYLTPLSGT